MSMINLLERILFLETLEKIFRLKAFLLKASISASEADRKVIKIFDIAINEIINSFEIVFRKLHDEYGTLDNNERFSCMRRISDVFNSIDDLHSQLRFIHGEWTVPETYIFVKSLFKPVIESSEEVSIVLSDSYMFEEVDLSRYLEWRLHYRSIPVDLIENRPTLFLPKIEYTNPLNWSILVHEMGHTLKKPLQDIFSDNDIKEISTTGDGIKMLENWTEEVWCDLIALKLLGPSYLASYITFSLLLASSGKIEESSPTHPADRFRISIMKAYLDKMGIELKFHSKFGEFDNICDFFDSLFEDRCKFEREHIIIDLPQRSQFPINYQKFRDFIINKMDDLTHEKIPLLAINNEKIRVLGNRLSDGILIGSSIENQNTDNLLKTLKKLDDIIAGNPDIVSRRDEIDALTKEVFDGVEEKPCNVAEIINAGWQYKCEVFYPKMIKLFFTKNEDINDCYGIFQKEMFLLDDNQKKSIEISHIHNLFTKRLESDSE